MIAGYERETTAVRESVFDFQMIVVINMVEMEKRKNARISSSAREMFKQIGRTKMRFQKPRRQTARPLVEIAEHQARRVVLSIQDLVVEQSFDLLAPLEKSRAEMNIVNVHETAIVDFNVNVLTSARLAPGDGDVEISIR